MSKRLTTEEWAGKAHAVHGSTYSYFKSSYITSKDKIEIICAQHGSFWQNPSSHLSGNGCPKCGAIAGYKKCVKNAPNILTSRYINYYELPTTFYYELPTTFYYVKFVVLGVEYFKVGITTKTLKVRFAGYPPHQVILTKAFDTGKEAFELEQYVLRKFIKYLYKGPKVITHGNTELFTTNILLKQGGSYEL